MIFAYLATLLVLGIYSYSQIDLNLTLFQNPVFLNFQNTMIQLGYYNRPLSVTVFIVLLLLLFLFRPKKLKFAILGVLFLGLFSYPAFSHDIFNYIFDARLAVFHQVNPYTATALDFPLDDWTRFMNWTHRTYPYGPVFLPITIIIYLLGFNKFVLTLVLFKALFVASYLGCCYVIHKMTKEKGLLFFALNPLIIIEGIISPHLDILMLFFALYAIYKKNWLSYLLSVGIKYSTLLLPPAIKNVNLLIILAFLGAAIQIGSREVLPHYFIVPLGFSALLPNNKKLQYFVLALSFVLLIIRYVPFLYTGTWLAIKF